MPTSAHGRRAGAHVHSHVCLPYESEQEDRAAVVAFVREGLEREQRCMYVGARREHGEIVAALSAAGVPVARAVERGALVMAGLRETYLRTGRFDAEDMLGFVDEQITAALAGGFTGFRGTTDIGGAGATTATWQKIVWYEAQLNERFARRPFSGLCRYPRAAIPAGRVSDLLRTHPAAWVRGGACDSPFYERAELAVSDDAQARLDWQLHQLRAYQRTRDRLADMTESAVVAAAALAAENHVQRETIARLEAALASRPA
jgi:hypothetical protein